MGHTLRGRQGIAGTQRPIWSSRPAVSDSPFLMDVDEVNLRVAASGRADNGSHARSRRSC
jgi:hypothetical protein